MARAAVRESVTLAGRAERARVVRAFVSGVLGPGHPCGDVPMIGGMIAGMLAATYLQGQSGGRSPGASRASVKALVTAGFVVMAAGLVIGTFTHVTSGTGFVAAWFAAVGIGLGLAMPTATNIALGALAPERSGSGSAVISAFRLVGATIGVAVLGTVLNSAYRSHLSLGGVPAAAAGAVRSSVAGGIEVAKAAGSTALLDMVRTAFAQGLDVMMWVCAAIAAVGALLALLFIPRRPPGRSATPRTSQGRQTRQRARSANDARIAARKTSSETRPSSASS